MSTHESMTPLSPERLAEIRGRVVAAEADIPEDACDFPVGSPWHELTDYALEDITHLLAEVKRLQQFESIVSWRYGDTTDGKTREDMIERAARAIAGVRLARRGIPLERLDAVCEDICLPDARAALDAALGTQEEA